MHKILAATLMTAAALASGALFAQQPATDADPKRGAVLADTCMGCHGIPGYRNAYPSFRVPKLGGQHPEYIVLALQGYRDQMRPHDTMHAQAISLSDQDMRDIAAFFATDGVVEPAANAPAAPEKAATCVACHGPGGVSVAPNWPTLAGQHRDYLEHSLREYKSGDRKDAVMGSQAIMLEEKDIRELAAWYAKQPGLFTVHYSKKQAVGK